MAVIPNGANQLNSSLFVKPMLQRGREIGELTWPLDGKSAALICCQSTFAAFFTMPTRPGNMSIVLHLMTPHIA
eukprot:9990859-Ditylum_brightwellii.AAC.1